jgi:hypothetical protein
MGTLPRLCRIGDLLHAVVVTGGAHVLRSAATSGVLALAKGWRWWRSGRSISWCSPWSGPQSMVTVRSVWAESHESVLNGAFIDIL